MSAALARRLVTISLALTLGALPPAMSVGAQDPMALRFDGIDPENLARMGVVVPADLDDEDEDGTPDARQAHRIPSRQLPSFRIEASEEVRIDVEGPLRVLRNGAPLALPATLRSEDLSATYLLQGERPTKHATVILERGGEKVRVPVVVIGASFLRADNRRLDSARDAVGISRAVTNDASLPRGNDYRSTSRDRENIRLEIMDPSTDLAEVRAVLESVDPRSGRVRATLADIPLSRPKPGSPFRSHWLRLVGDRTDARAPGVGDRVLRVALRDELRVRYTTPAGTIEQTIRVGRPAREAGPRAARRASLRVRILRLNPGGAPVIGTSDRTAVAIAREQVAIANEIWLQCFLSFGPPDEADVELVDPPPPTLFTVGDSDGLPARGDGVIRLRIDGRPIDPVTTRPGDPPVATALALAHALEAIGFRAQVTENAPTEYGAGRSADVLVRRPDGRLVTITPDGEAPLSTDAMQSITVGRIDLPAGVLEFDNMTAASGTIEERTLVKSLADDDPTTIDVFLISRFRRSTRQGEAFIKGDGGTVLNTVILDRNGVRQQRAAWTQAHEIGHVLLNHPLHPDNVGPDRPWLLMDSDTSLPLVTGPKRLTDADCARLRAESGPDTFPPLLSPEEPF